MIDLLTQLRELLGGGSPQSAEAVDRLLLAEREGDPLLSVALDYCQRRTLLLERLAACRAVEARVSAALESDDADIKALLCDVLRHPRPLHRRHLIARLAAGWRRDWTETGSAPEWLAAYVPAPYAPVYRDVLDTPGLTALCGAVGVARSGRGALYAVCGGHAFVPGREHAHWVPMQTQVHLPAPVIEHVRAGLMARWDAEAHRWTCSDPGMPPLPVSFSEASERLATDPTLDTPEASCG